MLPIEEASGFERVINSRGTREVEGKRWQWWIYSQFRGSDDPAEILFIKAMTPFPSRTPGDLTLSAFVWLARPPKIE
uniref:Uncharacterized protein n=1 Tax=Kalanchoe fedtschenkoi TaxID=63787 RepID=A0A7N0V3L9_KALFE